MALLSVVTLKLYNAKKIFCSCNICGVEILNFFLVSVHSTATSKFQRAIIVLAAEPYIFIQVNTQIQTFSHINIYEDN